MSTQWEAGTWTHWWLQTATRRSTPPWSATTPGRTPGGSSLSRRPPLSEQNENTHNSLEASTAGCRPRCRFVSSLPLWDFRFTVSLSHDVPLATSLGHCVYVLGSVERTGEKLLLQYDTRQGRPRQRQLTEVKSLKQILLSLPQRLLVGAAPHSDQSRCRPSRPSLPGCH